MHVIVTIIIHTASESLLPHRKNIARCSRLDSKQPRLSCHLAHPPYNWKWSCLPSLNITVRVSLDICSRSWKSALLIIAFSYPLFPFGRTNSHSIRYAINQVLCLWVGPSLLHSDQPVSRMKYAPGGSHCAQPSTDHCVSSRRPGLHLQHGCLLGSPALHCTTYAVAIASSGLVGFGFN